MSERGAPTRSFEFTRQIDWPNPASAFCAPLPGGKIFAALYAIFSGFLLIGISTLMLAPIFHRILHRFHVDEHVADPPQRRH